MASKKVKETTYQYQDALPSLPVPPLEQTLAAYIKSCEPLLTADELSHTKAICHEFLHGVGPKLQRMLEERGREKRNWLEEWWEQYGYLQPRYPSAININWFSVLPGKWQPREMTQIESATIFTIGVLKMRKSLLDGSYPVEKMQGKPLCMFTYSRMFNTCVIPGEECDTMPSYPHDAKHIIVLRNNNMWAVQVVDDKGDELPLGDIYHQLQSVRDEADDLTDHDKYPPVSVLTSENRTNWARAREHIIKLDPKNRESLNVIERAIFCLALDQTSAYSWDEIARNCLLGTGRNRWYDKPFTLVVHENGFAGINGQHVWADALVVVRTFDVVLKYINKNYRSAFADRSKLIPTTNARAKRLEWVLDQKAHTAIEVASAAIGKLIQSSDMDPLEFTHFGNAFLKRYKLTPDFFIQLAIQLAHYKLHKHVPAVYETAHTRLFYHGRTETIRSLTSDSLAFVKLMESDASKDAKWAAMLKAIATHKQNLLKCLNGNGIDRHLMGLNILSQAAGIDPLPSLFSDKAFGLSKKYLISTSNVSGAPGASPMWGGFSAMYEDGYGLCYAIQPDKINVSITAQHTCKETSATALKRSLELALLEMAELCFARESAVSKI